MQFMQSENTAGHLEGQGQHYLLSGQSCNLQSVYVSGTCCGFVVANTTLVLKQRQRHVPAGCGLNPFSQLKSGVQNREC